MNLALPATRHDNRFAGKWLRAQASRSHRPSVQATPPCCGVQEIAKAGIHEVKQALGVTIECLEGSVWVTLDGDLRDLVLDAGQSCKIDRKRRVLIQALDTARVRLTPLSGAL